MHRSRPRFLHGLLAGVLLGLAGLVPAVLLAGHESAATAIGLLLGPPTALTLMLALKRRWPACWGALAGGLLVLAGCTVWLMAQLSHMHVSM